MKAVRFIAAFSFLLIFSAAIFAQTDKDTKTIEDKDTKTVETPATKETIKPAEAMPAIPLKSQQERYRIGLHDVLDVIVNKHADYSLANVRLDQYGRIRLPYIAEPIMAVCKTETELAKEITGIYASTLLRNPFVSVTVKEQNSQPLAVIGAVKNPGRFYTNRRLTLLEVISYAGGPDVEFAGNTVQVARVGGISGCGDKEIIKSDEDGIVFFSYKLRDIQKGKTNPTLQPGDIVSVLDADTIYVYGNVNKEGKVRMNEPITLLQAIASAEGIKPASKSKIRILRQKPDSVEREELVFDLQDIQKQKAQDPFLQANDIIAVSEDPTKSIMRSIAKSFSNGIPSLFYRVP